MSKQQVRIVFTILVATLALTLVALTSCTEVVLRNAMVAMLLVELGLSGMFGWVLTHWK